MRLAQACFDGDMASCDELYRESDRETDPLYREFADTCAGRQPVGTGQWCEAAFPAAGAPTTIPGVTVPGVTVRVSRPGCHRSGRHRADHRASCPGVPPATQQPTGLGTDPTLDALAQGCYDGDMQACDDLFQRPSSARRTTTYGDTCAGRQAGGTYTYCHVAFPATQP